MLIINVLGKESWNEEDQEFVYPEAFELKLEHSLVSLSKWESEFEKPFLGPGEKTTEETIGYIKAMILTPDISDEMLSQLSEENIKEINNYIEAKRSATWFNDPPNAPKSREVITSELIYYWMFTAQIPIECETWHLNRLITLIRVFEAKAREQNNGGKKKRLTKSDYAQRAALNAQRRAQMGTHG